MWQVMVYSLAVAAALGLAGSCAEKLSAMLGWSRRFIWAAAMMLSIIWPLGMMLSARPGAMTASVMLPAVVDESATMQAAQPVPAVDLRPLAARSHSATAAQASVPALKQAPKQARWNLQLPSDRFVQIAWMVVSAALLLSLAGVDLLLHYRASRWQRKTVLGRQVLVSEQTGPALLGAWRPQIVMPCWFLDEPAVTQALILEHEQQHVVARDPLLLRLALCIVVLLPWNLPLWWQLQRLRQAIELDCDARVVRAGAEAGSYGQVLLAVTQRAGAVPVSAVAMGEPVSALERRIRQLAAGSARYSAPRALAALIFWAVGIGVAFALQAPALPRSMVGVSVSAAVPVPTLPLAQSPPQSPPQSLTLLAAAQAPSPTVSATSDHDDPRSRERTSAVPQSVGDALLAMVPVLPLERAVPDDPGRVPVSGVSAGLSNPDISAPESPGGGGMVAIDRPSFFIGNTIANLRGLDPAFSGRRLTLIDGRTLPEGGRPVDYSISLTSLSLPETWQDAPVFERRTCFASSDCSASADLILTRADGSTQLLASQVTGDFIVLPRSRQVFACADRVSSEPAGEPTSPAIVDLNGTRTVLPAHPGPVRFCLRAGSGDEVLLAYTMVQAGKAYTLARVFDASGALLVEGAYEKAGSVSFSVAGKAYSAVVPGP